ncbi:MULTISPECIES: EscU/YscU/HrcU family type III secretion system export apparatus switch protein [unclassified Pseudoalteromonas]|jgi:flagellar biosynthesis protein|uniref:EscU/YscU/HrcU family type III secretion system export apparatus switch protein n=1 Tax=unclassified Pseudoalteromonas TaxID=194690 RepID=UPI0005A95028|nr:MULTISPECIES: EscU/YscU/HrcU family type III secretion system export apparatus switch protein [unclassified Pseudoalteromonas]
MDKDDVKNSGNKSAIGLLYDGKSVPNVTIKGFGDFADHIIEQAKDKGVLIHEDKMLADTLKQLELGQEIPKELYIVIAELIAFSYVMQGKFPTGWQGLTGNLNIKA